MSFALLAANIVTYSNLSFFKKNTSDLSVSKSYFDISKIKELLKAGVWNLVTKLSLLFETELKMLIANIFAGATMMGLLALGRLVPVMLYSLCQMTASNFSPSWTALYARGEMEKLSFEIKKSIRIMSFISSIPASIFLVNGKLFYQLWLPNQDIDTIFNLAVLGSIVLLVAMPLETLGNVFTVTNQVKKMSINLLEWSIVMLITTFIGVYLFDDKLICVYIIATVPSILGSIRVLTFLPIYGAKCLNYNKWIFYPAIGRCIFCLILVCIVAFFINKAYNPAGWFGFIVGSIITGSIGFIFNWFISLTKNDREYLISIVKKKIFRL